MTGAAAVGIFVNLNDAFICDGRCHLSVKGITHYDATFKPDILPRNRAS